MNKPFRLYRDHRSMHRKCGLLALSFIGSLIRLSPWSALAAESAPSTPPRIILQRDTAVGVLRASTKSVRRSPRASRPGRALAAENLARGPDFPHLLIARGPKDPRPPINGEAPAPSAWLGKGNAGWDSRGLLAPSILSAERRARAEAMLEARTVEGWRAAYNRPADNGAPDTVRLLVLRADFLRDTPGGKTSGDGHFDLRRDEEAKAIPIDPPPHDHAYIDAHMRALARYYHVMTQGTLELAWDIYPAGNDSAYHLPDTRKYGPWIFSNSNPDVLQHAIDLVYDTLTEADADHDVDFSRYQSIVLMHAGADFQGDLNRDSPWDIPSFNLYVQEPFVVQDSTVAVNLVMVIPESATQDGYLGAMNGVIAHEFGHQMGFVDLYDVRSGTPVVGAFSVMDSGENLPAYIEDPQHPGQTFPVRGMLPASIDPWHKAVFFPKSIEVKFPEDFIGGEEQQFTAELPASEVKNRILDVPLNLSEYLLVENRLEELNNDSTVVLKSDKQTGVILGPVPADSNATADDLGYREYDYLLPGEGMLVWHVDLLALNYGLSLPGGGVNIFYGRPGVGLVEADGIRDIGISDEFTGGPYDPYYLGGYTCYGPNTVPSSNTNDGTPTGLTLCALDSIGPLMRATVSTLQNPAGWPALFTGSPGREQIVPMDLDGDGAKELVVAADSAVSAWDPAGGRVLLANAGRVQRGLAGREDFRYPGGSAQEPLLVAVAEGILRSVVQSGDTLTWPEPSGCQACDSIITATPVVTDSLIFVGCKDGRIRALAPDGNRVWRGVADVAHSAILVLGAGDLGQEGHEGDLTVFWAAERGEIGSFTWASQGMVDPHRWQGVTPNAAALPRPVSLLAAPTGPGGAARYLVLWEDGTLAWYERDGSLVLGWPVQLGADPAGEPIVCDVDQDGILETVVADSRSILHCYGENGVEELHWPRSLYSEDYTDLPVQTLGPRALDVNGDGKPEIVIHRTDGMVLAWDSEGKNVSDWPRALGSDALSEPIWIPAGGVVGPRIAVVNSWGRTSTGELVSALSPLRIPETAGRGAGFFSESGVDIGRSRVYPRAWLPAAPPPPQVTTTETLRLYPNPLRTDALTVHFQLTRAAHVRLDAFDLAGRRVADLETSGEAGMNGNQVLWNLGALAPGLYQIRFRVLGDGETKETYQKLAVVR